MSEDIFALNAQVQAIIERAKEQAKGYRDGSFRDNAMQVIVELDSRLQQAQQRENERIAQAVAAERARILERLEWVLRNKGGIMPFDTAIDIVKGE